MGKQKTKVKRGMSIKTKAALFVYFNAVVVAVISGVLIYFLVFNMRTRTIGAINAEIAEMSSNYVSDIADRRIAEIRKLSNSPFWKNFIKEQDKGPDVYSDPEDADKKWLEMETDDVFSRKILGNELSLRLQNLVEGDRDVSELFITDRYGYVLAASRKTSDLYQGDEEWWQKTFSGKIFIGDVTWDESNKTAGLVIAVPVIDEYGEVIGTCKAIIDASATWGFLNDIGYEETGHVALINEQGQIIVHRNITPLSEKIPISEQLKEALANGTRGYKIIFSGIHGKRVLSIVKDVNNSQLLDHGISWKIVSTQEISEVFTPLNSLFLRAIVFIFMLTIAALFFGFLFIGFLLKPLGKLNHAIKHISEGNLEYRINSPYEDEVGHISNAFDKMVAELKGSTTVIGKLSCEIVERKRVEEELKKSEDQYRIIYESSRDALMTLSPYGKFLSGNSATVKMFACKNEEEFLSKAPADLSPEYQPDGQSSRVKSKEVMKKAIDEGSNLFEWVHQTTTGKEFFATVLLTSVKVEDRYILQATVRDITDQKKALKEITSLSIFMSENPNPVLRISDKGDVIYKNEAVAAILEDEGLEEKEAFKVLPYELKERMRAIIDKGEVILEERIQLGDKVYAYSITPIKTQRYANLYGKNITAQIKAQEVLSNTKKELEVQAWGLKKTNDAINLLYKELERKNTRLQELDKLKSDFISNVSHELRTPLAITKEGISLVLDGVTGEINEQQDKMLNTARKNIDRLARIINNLLDMSKIESGKMELKKEVIDMGDLVEQIAFSFQVFASEKNIDIRSDVPKTKVEVFADRDKLIQVFTNLVGNAMKFTKEGQITIALKDQKHLVECSVQDSGVGIRKEELQKVFERFHQVDRKNGAGEKGTGLGLAITKEIVEKHGGSVWVESEEKEGSKFIFTIPKDGGRDERQEDTDN
jgi:PAS domain S-box-containing protein